MHQNKESCLNNFTEDSFCSQNLKEKFKNNIHFFVKKSAFYTSVETYKTLAIFLFTISLRIANSMCSILSIIFIVESIASCNQELSVS